MEKPRLLLLLPQIPHDPGSGAARTMTLTVTLLAKQGFEIHAVGTTASESRKQYDALELLKAQGANPISYVSAEEGKRELHYTLGGLACVLLDTGAIDPENWRRSYIPAYNEILAREVASFRPHVVFTYGGYPDDVARTAGLRAAGVAVVLGLWNLGYLTANRAFFQRFDAIITPSQFMADVYQARCGIRTTVFATPIIPEQVRADRHQPVFFTMVNPSWDKGLAVLIRIAEMLGTRRPDIPLLIVESRGTAGDVLGVARGAGIDLARHANIMFSPSVAAPLDFFAVTRATLIPSLVSEGSGRVASESMVAGIPALVTDRGGLPAEVGQGGFVMELPDDLHPDSRSLPNESIALPWIELMEKLADDESFYRSACARAQCEGRRFLPETIAPSYRDFFARVIERDAELRPFA